MARANPEALSDGMHLVVCCVHDHDGLPAITFLHLSLYLGRPLFLGQQLALLNAGLPLHDLLLQVSPALVPLVLHLLRFHLFKISSYFMLCFWIHVVLCQILPQPPLHLLIRDILEFHMFSCGYHPGIRHIEVPVLLQHLLSRGWVEQLQLLARAVGHRTVGRSCLCVD